MTRYRERLEAGEHDAPKEGQTKAEEAKVTEGQASIAAATEPEQPAKRKPGRPRKNP